MPAPPGRRVRARRGTAAGWRAAGPPAVLFWVAVRKFDLRVLLHTINRRSRITMIVLVNEVFANTGFQCSPAATPFSDTSTTPAVGEVAGNLNPPIGYLHMAMAAGADLVAQVSPAHGRMFQKTVEDSLAVKGTAVIFVPAPCISGWKYEDGKTIDLALDGARAGVYPTFVWKRGEGGKVVDCKREAKDRPSLEEFLAAQRRFVHLIERDRKTGEIRVKPGREPQLEAFRTWVQDNVEHLYQLAEVKK